jgi:hypothetical protein
VSVRADVDRGLAIVATLETLKKELKEINERLEAAALLGVQVDLVDPEREGKRFLAPGTDRIVPVVLTADSITKSFVAHSKKHKAISEAAGDKLLHFYVPTTTYEAVFESGKMLRTKAAEIFGFEDAPPFVSACLARDKHGIPKSDIKVEWDRAEKKTEVPA